MINSGSKSSRLLASRRYTHDSFTDAQESFTNVLDLQASEVYTQAHKIPSGSLPFSGSSQNGSFHIVDGENILRYYYRHKLTKSNLNNEVWFFLNPTGSASGIGAQLIDDDQQTNFISPKYSVSSLANATAEDSTPGYLAKVFISNAADSASVSDSDVISVNDYQFDYKTGVLQFKNSSVDPTNSQYVYMSVNQYVGKTLADGVEITGDISGSASSTGSFGHLVVAGNITASGVIRADAFESVTGGNSIDFKDSINVTGNLTASGDLSIDDLTASGNISGSLTSTGSLGKLIVDDKIGVGIKNPIASVHISASDGIIIPVGNTAQRSGDAIVGEIRFNTTLQSYEGYDGNNWGTLGGMTDIDKDTLITAETSAGADNDELIFFTAGAERLRIFAAGHISASGNITASSNLEVHGDISGSVTSSGSLGHLYIDNKIGIGTVSPKNSLHISSSDGIIIPVGTTAQRTSNPVAGEIRFNSQQNTYEGYDGNNWGTLGGVIDVDQDTRISAENNAGDDNDQLRFFTNGVERLRINSDGQISASVNITASNNLRVDGNLIVSNLSNSNIFNFSSSLNKKVTAITSSISALKNDSASFSLRATQATASIAAITSSINNLKTDSGSFSLRITQATASIAQITQSIVELKSDSGSFSLRGTNLETTSSALINNFDQVQSLGKTDNVIFNHITASGNIKASNGYFTDPAGIYADKIRRYSDSGTTTKIVLNDEVIKLHTGDASEEVVNIQPGQVSITGNITASGDVRFQSNLVVDGKVTAQEFHTEIVSSSIVFTSGSTKFGDSIDDVHNFTGSLFISGNLTAVNLVADSGSVSTRLTAITSSISALKSDSGSFSTRTTAITSSISALKTDSGSFSTRLTAITSSISALKTDSGSMSLRMTQATASIAAITSSIDELKQDSGSFSLRNTNLEITSSALINNFDNVQSLGTTDTVRFANITSSGDVSGSLTSTGSFGMIKKDGLDIREHFSRNTVEAFELDENGDFQPTDTGQYVIDPRWELDENGDLQRRKRELWTFDWDSYFSD